MRIVTASNPPTGRWGFPQPEGDGVAPTTTQQGNEARGGGRDGTASMGEAAASCLGFYSVIFNCTGDATLAHSHGGALHLWRWEPLGSEDGNDDVAGSNPGGGGGVSSLRAACTGHVHEVTCISLDAAAQWFITGSEYLPVRLHADWRSGAGGIAG